MNLQKKVDKVYSKAPVQAKTASKVSSADIDMSSELPAGKHAGKTVEWIARHDSSYYDWVLSNGILHNWGCVLQKETDKAKKKYSGFISSGGEYWLGIREIQEQGIASIW